MMCSVTFLRGLAALLIAVSAASPAVAQATPAKKPNILVIWGDDIGQFNISAYNNGVMGYRAAGEPRLTTVALPQAEIGRQAMTNLLELLRSPDGAQQSALHSQINTCLIVRESTAVPKGR